MIFLLKIRDLTVSDSILVTWDISSLYTIIPHKLGIGSCDRLLTASRLYNTTKITFLMQLLQIVIEENVFLFKETYYLQIRGAAMGSNVAPPYANTFVDMVEESFIFNNVLFKENCTCGFRFLDDVFVIWESDLNALSLFLHILIT